MAKVKFQQHLYSVDYGDGKPQWRLWATPTMSDKYWTLVGPVEVEVEVPDDFDARPAKIAALEAEKQKLRAAFAARVTEIEREISQLQAITCEVA
jgi:hypothetical protein